MTTARPSLGSVLETVLYYTDQQRALAFYRDLLGMRLLASEPRRSLFFRAGASVFLLFDADETLAAGTLPAHGARGPVHTCFRVPADDYDRWKRYLPERGVALLHETRWRNGRSFYFHDPDGNLLEIADNDIWPG
ncbi:MAG TPA: VOC family protein [Candidatus Polarisedimenticolaceae bacterium]|nr:VOC family protein [Candidatus Polarisedimenticolaceae bacterium]